MELQRNQQGIFGKRKSHPGGVRWVKEWVPQDLACTGGKCCVLKWVREDVLQALKEQSEGQGGREPEPEPTTEILFLCSFEGCGKTFIDAGALRKHSHIHGERQYACHYEGCGKKFLDSSKLKRHFLIHTGQRDYICPHEGCGKAFSLDFNLRAHMRTHTQENYHLCPYEGCGKRFAHDYKLQAHIKANHEKISMMNTAKHALSIEKHHIMHSSPTSNQGSGSSSRPYVCPYKGCGKDYIHEYKLNLHLRKEHSSPYFVESHKHASTAMFGNGLNVHDQDDFVTKVAINGTYKSSKHYLKSATTVLRKELAVPNLNVGKQWLARGQADSEETEGNGKIDDGWVYQKTNEYNEDTEDEE